MILPRIAHRLWTMASSAEARRFANCLERPGPAQAARLRAILAANATSEFGRIHRFASIDSVGAFRRAVPLQRYDDFRPAIDRIRQGEPGVLTAEPVERLLPTSGSSGALKLVPSTAALRSEFARAIAAWTHDLFRLHPACRGGPAYWSVSPAIDRPEIESALPIGFEDDSAYVGGALAPLVRSILAVPPGLQRERDASQFTRRCLVSLLRARELRLVSVWHPTAWTLLLDALIERWPELLEGLGREAPARAKALAATDPRDLAAIWPKLAVVSCWTDGHAARAAGALRARLPATTALLPKGLLSTEAVTTIPFAGQRPLALRSHFVEFLDDDGVARGVDEVRIGGEYEIVVTTGGGLYRYRTGDRVRCDRLLGRTPSLVFLGRMDAVSDLRGEKLSDAHVGAVLSELFGTRRTVRFAMLAPEASERDAGYALCLHDAAPADAGLADRLDRALRANPHYDLCRRLGQLRPVRIVAVVANAEERVVRERARRGQKVGDIKPTALARELGWPAHLVALADAAQATRVATASPNAAAVSCSG